MAELVEIKCVDRLEREDPNEVIAAIRGDHSGTEWKLSLAKAVEGVESGRWQFYVRVDRKTVDVIISTHNGHKYLKSTVDDIWPESLLRLPVKSH